MKKSSRLFASKVYLTTHRNPKTHMYEPDADGYLFAKGLYRTKIRPEDLPEWYVEGQLYHQDGYISAKGVKCLLYKPNYIMPHLHKDDLLFISYDKPIEPDDEGVQGIWYHGYDHIVWGGMILPFLQACKAYSGYNISAIMDEVKNKEQWYEKHYGK